MNKKLIGTLVATLMTNLAFGGDGSDEAGFVKPPEEMKLPPPPPRSSASAETYIPGGCTTPMARTEAKKPPKPPALITKLK